MIGRWWLVASLALIIVVGGAIGFATSRHPASSPPPPTRPSAPAAPAGPRSAFGFSAVDDPAHQEVVLYGGVDSYSQTWLWNGRRWTEAHPEVSPPGRFDAPAAYDPVTGLVLLYGGQLADGELAGDTWTWDGSNWKEVDAGLDGPPFGGGGAMAWDPALNSLVLAVPKTTPGGLSGETWVWSGTGWTRLTGSDFPLGVQPVAAVFDTINGSLLALGSTASGSLTGVLDFVTLSWSGSAWTVVPAAIQPDSFAGLAREPISGRLMVAAQNGVPAAPTTSTAWSWTGADWTLLHQTSGPPWPQAEATDVTRSRLLLFATLVPASQNTPQPIHVWSWQGSRWQRVDGG